MSFSLGEKDKTDQPSTSSDTRKNPLESITDPERQDELERGGMIMGPNHPGFRSEQQQQQGHTVETGTTQQLRLPKGSVPPGARFDPIVPGDETRLNRVGSGQYGTQPITGPDNDEFLPPGQESSPQVTQQPPTQNLRPSTFQDPTKRIGERFGRGNFGGGGRGFHF